MDHPSQETEAETSSGAVPRLLTYEDLARLTGLSKGSLYSMVAKGQLPHVRLGRRFVRFTEIQIQNWLQARTITPAIAKSARR
jgi:excisionase family DNA binding protein